VKLTCHLHLTPSFRMSGATIFFWRKSPQWARASSLTRFLDHTQRRTTVGRTPLDERSAQRRDLYLTTHNTHNRQKSMPTVGFEPTISTGERPQTYALDCAATGTGGVTPLVTVSAFMGCTRKTLPFTAHQCCQHNMSVSFITTDDVWDLDTASYFPLNFIQTFFCRSSLGYLRVKSTIMCYKLKLFGKEQS